LLGGLPERDAHIDNSQRKRPLAVAGDFDIVLESGDQGIRMPLGGTPGNLPAVCIQVAMVIVESDRAHQLSPKCRDRLLKGTVVGDA